MKCQYQITHRFDRWMRLVALALFLAAVFFFSWNSDDAYHSYIMARHLVEGKGLVYNTGYRVSASTCPLLTLIEAFVFLFTNSPDVCGLLIGLLFSGAAAWVLFFRFCQSPLAAFCTLGLMLSSRSFLNFTTSGLENPLLFFFGALFFDSYFRDEQLSARTLFVVSFLMSLLAMTRADSVLIFVPMAVWAYFARTNVSFPIRVMLGLGGLLPFIVWTCFSVLYYGFPFPNTYYAKLYTGIPLSSYIAKGLAYFWASWLRDPMLIIAPVVAVVLAIKRRKRLLILTFMGLALYSVYVISVGGDFMSGRHLTQQFFLSACIIAVLLKRESCAAGVDSRGYITLGVDCCSSRNVLLLLVILFGIIWNWIEDAAATMSFDTYGVWDERRYYLSQGGEKPLYFGAWSYLSDNQRTAFRDVKRGGFILEAHAKGDRGAIFGDKPELFAEMGFGRVLFGRDIFAASELDMYLTDVIALQDPLMARLKVDLPDQWIVGHVVRDIPCGYHETVASGQNQIVDKSLHAYYDKLLLVMNGPLFDRDRLAAIVGFNLGRYDYLLREYEQSKAQCQGK